MRLGEVSCRALIDSGYTWRTVISLDLATTMGLKKRDLKALPGPPVQTASEGVNLEVLGAPTRALELHVPYLGRSFKCRPAIVKGLSMPANISGPWLKMHGWDHLHTQDCLSIGGVKVPLTKSRSETQQAHQLYALSPVTLGPRSAAVVKVLAPSLAHFMKTGEQEALWEGKGIGPTDADEPRTWLQRRPLSSLSRKGEWRVYWCKTHLTHQCKWRKDTSWGVSTWQTGLPST